MRGCAPAYYDRKDDKCIKRVYYLHCWYFLDKEFLDKLDVCNGCDDVLMMPMNLKDIAFLNIHDIDYCHIINEVSKSEAINFF